MRNPEKMDIHNIAIGNGAAYIQEAGRGVSAYIFTPESLAALLVKTAAMAKQHKASCETN